MAAYGTFTLTGHYEKLDGVPASGRVTIVSIPAVLVDADGNTIHASPTTAVLDTTGSFSVALPTDVTTGQSTAIGYRVTAQLKHRSLDGIEFYAKANGATLAMDDVTPQTVEAIGDTMLNADRAETAADEAEAAQTAAEAAQTAAQAAETAAEAAQAAAEAALATQGGATTSDRVLKEWTSAEAFEAITVTRDTLGLVTTVALKWPDDSLGTFTTTTVNTTHQAIDAYTVTHVASNKKVTQTAVTRNSDGFITAKPALTVGAI